MAVPEEFTGSFECRRCGYETTASVRAAGHRGFFPTAPVEGGARPHAETADEVAGVVASRTLMFVACPRCHQRDPSAGTYRVQVILGALLAGIAAAVLAFIGAVKSGTALYLGNATYGLVAFTGLVATGSVYRTYRRAWVDVEQRVVLRPPA